MPNWCSNRMYFSGEPAQIAEIKRLASGAVTPFYRRATNEGIQLFLAGSAGLLQTTEDVQFELCPGLTAAGRGAVSPENIAFTRWLTHLQNGVLLDEQNCLMLHELWLQSGTGQRRWEGLPDDVRETITVHFTAKRGDWCDIWGTGGNDPEELLNDTETTASANIVRYVLIVAVRSQIDLLQLLYRKGLLRTEIPGGFSPEEAQELLDNLVRSHISKALSGERMAARDRNADLTWIRQQLVDAAWFVRATLEAHGMGVGNESPSAPPETMPDIQTRELVMLIKRLASSLKAVKPDSSVVREAQDWLCDRKLVDITDILR